jgi:hypothetical protein
MAAAIGIAGPPEPAAAVAAAGAVRPGVSPGFGPSGHAATAVNHGGTAAEHALSGAADGKHLHQSAQAASDPRPPVAAGVQASAPTPLMRYGSSTSLSSQPSPAVTATTIAGAISAEASPAIGFMHSSDAASINGPHGAGNVAFSGGALSAYGGPDAASWTQPQASVRPAAAHAVGSASAILHAAAPGVSVSPLIQSNPPPKDAVAPMPNGASYATGHSDPNSASGAGAGAGAGAANGQKKRFLIMDATENGDGGMDTPSSRRTGSSESAQPTFPSHAAGPPGAVPAGAAGAAHEPVGNPTNHHWPQQPHPQQGLPGSAPAVMGAAYTPNNAGPGIAGLRGQGGADGAEAARPVLPHGRTTSTLLPTPAHGLGPAGGPPGSLAATRSGWRSQDVMQPHDDPGGREGSGGPGGAALNPPGQPSADAQASARRPQPQPYAGVSCLYPRRAMLDCAALQSVPALALVSGLVYSSFIRVSLAAASSAQRVARADTAPAAPRS